MQISIKCEVQAPKNCTMVLGYSELTFMIL